MMRANWVRKAGMLAATCALSASLLGLAACSGSGAAGGAAAGGGGSAGSSLDQRVAAAQASHAGRYEVSGSHGCFGCHGANDSAWPILASAPQLPAFHFDVDAPKSFDDLGDAYQDCAACHIEITGKQGKSASEQSAGVQAGVAASE